MASVIMNGLDEIKKFLPGDRVTHISMGDGVVVHSPDPREVRVRYVNGEGRYDARWFELHCDWLSKIKSEQP